MNRIRPLPPLVALALAGLLGCPASNDSHAPDAADVADVADPADAALDTSAAPDAATAPPDTSEGPPDATVDTSAPPDTRDTVDPIDTNTCHYDCFGGSTCVDGVFVALLRIPIPCGPNLDEARNSPYGICGHHGEKTPCVSGLCTDDLCSDDHDLLEDLVGPDAAPTPCDVRLSPLTGASPTLTVGPESDPLFIVSDFDQLTATPSDELTMTVVATLSPAQVTLGGAAATTQTLTHATLYGAAVLPPMSASNDLPICRGALVATLADGAEVRVVWSRPIDCYSSQPPYQASCRVLHVPADEAQ